MAFAVIGLVLVLLALVAWIVWLLRPKTFKFKITLGKLACLHLGMRSRRKPQRRRSPET